MLLASFALSTTADPGPGKAGAAIAWYRPTTYAWRLLRWRAGPPKLNARVPGTSQAYCRSSARISSVFSCISAASARLSTFRRTRGSVFDERRLKRHALNSTDKPSV
jgi:hypothetical protein